MPQVSVPSPTPELIDKSLLNDSERQFMEIFERRGQSSSATDDTTLTSAEDLSETTGTPGSTGDPQAAPEAPTTVEGQSGASVSEPSPEDTSGTSSESGAGQPVEGEEAQEPVLPDATEAAFTFAGKTYDSSTLARAVQVHDWYDRLETPQLQAIDALLSGQYRLVPANEPAPVSPVAPQTQATSPTSSTSDTSTVGDEVGDWLDPRAEAEINRLRAELSQVQSQVTGVTDQLSPVVQSQADAQLQARLAAINSAHDTFRDEYSLTDDQMQEIGQAVVQSGIFPSLLQRHNGDTASATRAALDMMFWSTPQFRDLAVNNKVTAITTDTKNATDLERQRKASTLASSGGSVPRPPSNPTPQTPSERHAAMVEAIRTDMNGNGQVV